MASTNEGSAGDSDDVRIEPSGSAGDSEQGGKEELGSPGEMTSTVERLRSLVLCADQNANMDDIRRLIAKPLPASACGVEDAISNIRANLWSAMLLGLRPEDLISQHELVSSSLHGRSSEEDHAAGLMHFPKEDQRVLAADIKRTRQAYAMFKRPEVMQLVSQVLERYCVGHSIRYKQGQNELIAPFVMLQDPPLPLPVLGLLFESFMSRFVSRWFVDDEIEALLVSYRVFRVLLFYLDPGLANKLDEADFVPELYATAWLITLFSRNLSMELVVRLWDVYLAVNDPALVFFLLAALLVRNRDTILRVDQAHMMPETVQSLTVTDKKDLEELIIQAREMLRKIPGSFLQTVRSCCSDQCNVPLDTSRSLFCESVRCVSIGPAELLERMTTRRPETAVAGGERGGGGGQEKHAGSGNGTDSGSPCPMRPGDVFTVALDIRPLDDYENSGVGHLGKSLRLDPYLLEMEEVLEKWLEHFDGTRGTHICLVDSLDPSTAAAAASYAAARGGRAAKHGDDDVSGGGGSGSGRNRSRSESGGGQQQQRQRQQQQKSHRKNSSTTDSSSAMSAAGRIIEDPLWRRLLFGEGEMTEAGDGTGADAEWSHAPDNGQGGRGQGGGAEGGGNEGFSGEGFGAARAFAQKLHARGFPYVSILEGGMEGIVEHLRKEGSPLEPTVIDHDPEAYRRWREAQASRVAAAQPQEGQERSATSRAGEAFSWRGSGTGTGGHGHAGGEAGYYDPAAAAFLRENEPQHQGHTGGGAKGVIGGGGGADEGLQRGQAKVGVFDRLGLVKVRDGVSVGVGTVARTGAWAVRGGAGLLASSFSSDSGEASQPQSRGHVRTDSGNIWEEEDDAEGGSRGGGGGGGGLNGLVHGGLVDSNDVKAIFGAMKTAQAGVRDGITRGVGTVRRTGAWAVKEGAGIIQTTSSPSGPPLMTSDVAATSRTFDPIVIDGGGGVGRSRRSGGGTGGVEGRTPEEKEKRVAVGVECDVEGSDEEALVVALETAEANGHLAVAKALRGRLGFVRGQALRVRLAQEKNGGVASDDSAAAGTAAADAAGTAAADAAGTAPSSDRQFDETLAT